MKQILTLLTLGTLSLMTLSPGALAHGKGCNGDAAQCKAKWEAKKAAFEAACGADVKTYCSPAAAAAATDKKKFWEVRKCLRSNENSLKDACKAQLKEGGHRHKSS